jgi:uncharacterized membrane protein YcaP (DUF421 family)
MQTLYAFIGPEVGSATWWQLCIRAVLLFAVGVACIRIAGRRTFSQATPMDIVVAIIVGSNLSRAMTGRAPFLPAIAATLTLVALHRLLAMATLHWGPLARILKSTPAVLLEDGKVDQAALRHHGISEADLLEGLRLEQAEHPEEVRLATLEGNGRISVVPRRDG